MRFGPSRSLRPLPLCLVFFLLLAGSLAASAEGAQWHVSPIRLDLGRQAKSGSVKVTNDGEEPMQLQMKAMEWTQDAEGKDRYEETQDLVFFPKIMELKGKEARVIRAGIRVPAGKTEKTYRLFIQEIPVPGKPRGTSVAIALRFGLPIFVKPVREEEKGEIGSPELEQGTVRAEVRNRGNVHFSIRSVVVKGIDPGGQPVFEKELSGWYLLAGASRKYSVEIPGHECKRIATFEVSVKTDRFPLEASVPGDPSRCGPDADGGPPR